MNIHNTGLAGGGCCHTANDPGGYHNQLMFEDDALQPDGTQFLSNIVNMGGGHDGTDQARGQIWAVVWPTPARPGARLTVVRSPNNFAFLRWRNIQCVTKITLGRAALANPMRNNFNILGVGRQGPWQTHAS
jgi:hypothetical protein